LEPREVLLVVAAQVVHQAANGDTAALELRGARELLRRKFRNESQGFRTRPPECTEDLGNIGRGVAAF
jgi:hypothetical protein